MTKDPVKFNFNMSLLRESGPKGNMEKFFHSIRPDHEYGYSTSLKYKI